MQQAIDKFNDCKDKGIAKPYEARLFKCHLPYAEHCEFKMFLGDYDKYTKPFCILPVLLDRSRQIPEGICGVPLGEELNTD